MSALSPGKKVIALSPRQFTEHWLSCNRKLDANRTVDPVPTGGFPKVFGERQNSSVAQPLRQNKSLRTSSSEPLARENVSLSFSTACTRPTRRLKRFSGLPNLWQKILGRSRRKTRRWCRSGTRKRLILQGIQRSSRKYIQSCIQKSLNQRRPSICSVHFISAAWIFASASFFAATSPESLAPSADNSAPSWSKFVQPASRSRRASQESVLAADSRAR